jgi:hypothetical protein
MTAGSDSIDDVDVLRSGGMKTVFDGVALSAESDTTSSRVRQRATRRVSANFDTMWDDRIRFQRYPTCLPRLVGKLRIRAGRLAAVLSDFVHIQMDGGFERRPGRSTSVSAFRDARWRRSDQTYCSAGTWTLAACTVTGAGFSGGREGLVPASTGTSRVNSAASPSRSDDQVLTAGVGWASPFAR